MKPNETFWAWLAGFIDGDGCFTLRKNKITSGRTPVISIGQRNKAILQHIKSQVGFGCIGQNKIGVYSLLWTSKQAKKILLHINQYLQLKKEQSILLLEACKLNSFCHRRNSQPTFLKIYHEKLSIIDRQLRNMKKIQVA